MSRILIWEAGLHRLTGPYTEIQTQFNDRTQLSNLFVLNLILETIEQIIFFS